MKIELNETYLKRLEPPEIGRLEISDTKRAGLRLRVYSSGRAVWMYEKRIKGGAKRKHTLGVYCTWSAAGKRETGPIGLAEARRVALDIEAEAARGFDRVLDAENARHEEQKAAASIQTVQNVLDIYAELHLSNLKSGDERNRQLTDALTKYLDKPIGTLTRASLQKPVDDKAKDGKLFMANRIRAALKHFTRWAWRREYLEEDVGDRLERATKERIRERILSLSEIREIWVKSFELGELWGPLLRLLLLTVQRRSSVTGLRKSELDMTNTRFKKAISDEKNERAHTTHLSQPAMIEVETALKRLDLMEDAKEDYLFSTTGRTPVSGWSKAKVRLDKLLGEEFEHWRFHDIRTAFATHMAERGVSESVVDRVLNHAATASKASAVARVYNQAELLSERAIALDKWAELVARDNAKVVRIGARS